MTETQPTENHMEVFGKGQTAFKEKNVEEFNKFVARLKEAGIENPPLHKLNYQWKDPAATNKLQLEDKSLNPIYKLTVEQAREIISNGGNVGCYASKDGIEIHDIDLSDGEFTIPKDKVDELITIFDTLTIMTRSGGRDLIFKNTGGDKNPHIYYNGEVDAGEVRRNWQYAASPGSFIPRDKVDPSKKDRTNNKGFTEEATGLYTVINDAPIREFDESKAPDWYKFEKTTKKKDTNIEKYISSVKTNGLSDEQIIEKARLAKNCDKFISLYDNGNVSNYDTRSEADLALANILAFYTDSKDQIIRIMRRSHLSTSEKYDRDDYLKTTVGKAIEDKGREMWNPGYVKKSSPPITTESEPPKHITEIDETEIQAIRDEHIKLFKELPELPEGFFHDYMEYGKRMSYAYPAYHLAGALTLVSLICGRRIAVKSTAATIYGNIFAMCIGPTSISGKSTANDFVSDFFTLVRQEGTIDELPKKMSPQGLLQRLDKIPCRLWSYDECSEFFTDSQAHWGEALESNLCSIYDGRTLGYGLAVKKKEQSEWLIKNAYVTCLWNTTSSGIEQQIQMRSVSSGLVPRFMWFWMHGSNDIRKNRNFSADDIQNKLKLQREMGDLQKVLTERPINETSITFGISDVLEDWFIEDLQSHLSKEDELHRVCTARLVPQAYKIAMLFAMMDKELQAYIGSKKPTEPINLTIPEKYAKVAKHIAEHYLRPRLEYVINLARYNDGKNFQDIIRKSISNHDGVATKSQIIRDTRLPKRQLEEALDTMVEGEVIEEIIIKTDKKTRMNLQAYKLIHT